METIESLVAAAAAHNEATAKLTRTAQEAAEAAEKSEVAAEAARDEVLALVGDTGAINAILETL